MENINSKNILELLTKGGVSAVLLIIILYFGGAFINSMQQVQKQLASIKIEIAKVQLKILTPQTVEKMIEDKCKLHQYHYHNKEAK